MGCNCGKRKLSTNTKKVPKVPTSQNKPASNKPYSGNSGKRIIRRALY